MIPSFECAAWDGVTETAGGPRENIILGYWPFNLTYGNQVDKVVAYGNMEGAAFMLDVSTGMTRPANENKRGT